MGKLALLATDYNELQQVLAGVAERMFTDGIKPKPPESNEQSGGFDFMIWELLIQC
jgi:hypothetical protein